MNTAGISGANDDAVSPALPPSRRNVPPTPGRFSSTLRFLRLSPSARSISGLIFGLCGALIVTDIILSEIEASHQASLAARLVAASLNGVEASDFNSRFRPVSQALDPSIAIFVSDRDGMVLGGENEPLPSTALAMLPAVTVDKSIVGPLGAVTVSVQQNAILAPVILRSIFGIVIAGGLAIHFARRAGHADTKRRAQALNSAVAMATDGAIIWDRDQKLISASDRLHNLALVPPSLLRRGTGYGAFLDGMRKAGDLEIVSTTRVGRRLRLSLPVGETWEMREALSEDGLLVTQFFDESERARLKGEVAQLRSRVGEMADEVQNQRVRGDAASRSKTLFLGQLSHSLRTPLNHIIGFADLLRHQSYGPLGDLRYLDYAGNIKQSGEVLLDTLSNMLELAEFDSGVRRLAREPVRLSDLFDWAAGRYGEQARRAGITLALERDDSVVVNGDLVGLKRMIGNLMDNGVKFTPAGGSLTLAAWPTDDGVVLEFTDTGIGIAPETLNVLNTSFALGNESNGNGIAIARAIAELSGGQLQINSSLGIGTTVAVVLPTVQSRTGKRVA